MFSLYIDNLLIGNFHRFSEVRDFIFYFYYDVVKDEEFFDLSDFTSCLDEIMDETIKILIDFRMVKYSFHDHEAVIYYGRSTI